VSQISGEEEIDRTARLRQRDRRGVALFDRSRHRPLFGPKEAKRRFTRAERDAWLQSRGVMLVGIS
jgi:hypothetical protein